MVRCQTSEVTVKNKFVIERLSFETIREMEGARPHEDYVSLLAEMDFDETAGMGPEEIVEMCLMSLQDLKPEEAAALVLKHDMGDTLTPGQINNSAVEMLDEKLWEEYATISLHQRMFTAGGLLYRAFPRIFPKPDAVEVTIAVTAANDEARAELAEPVTDALVLRLLADGMNDHAILRRLFHDQLAGDRFDEAEHILWSYSATESDSGVVIKAVSSGSFFDALEDAESWESTAHSDG